MSISGWLAGVDHLNDTREIRPRYLQGTQETTPELPPEILSRSHLSSSDSRCLNRILLLRTTTNYSTLSLLFSLCEWLTFPYQSCINAAYRTTGVSAESALLKIQDISWKICFGPIKLCVYRLLKKLSINRRLSRLLLDLMKQGYMPGLRLMSATCLDSSISSGMA